MSYIDTFYLRTIANDDRRPPLRGVAECDVAIVGGGLSGLTTALQLARAGKSVVLLESERIGWGASGRNGGFVGAGYATGSEAIARMAGADNARKLHQLSIEGMRFVRATIDELKIESANPKHGIMGVQRYDGGGELKAYADKLAKEYDYHVEFKTRDEVRSVLHSQRYFEGVRDPNAFHMHPLNYLRAVAAEIERLGGRIYEQSPAVSASLDGAEKVIVTTDGTVKAATVVLSTGGYTTGLVPKLKLSSSALVGTPDSTVSAGCTSPMRISGPQ